MDNSKIPKLIINSPYHEPKKHWHYDRQKQRFYEVEGRRPAGFVIASGDSKAYDDPGIFKEIPLVKSIRPRVKKWRDSGYPGVTGMTRRLLEYWNDPEEFENRRFFGSVGFCMK